MKPIKQPHILIVEDSDELARLMQIMLRDMGFHSEIVHTGHGALEFLAQKTPDLMILDIRLPEMSGWKVLDQAGNHRRITFPVIVLTAHHDPMNRLIGTLNKPPVVRFLRKPFKIAALTTAVREALNLADT